MSSNPYDRYLAGDDPIRSLDETARQIAQAVAPWAPSTFGRSHAPGKWTARQVLVHLAQCEMVFASRLRFGVAEEGYVLQPFNQDGWMGVEPEVGGQAALSVYRALREMNLALCQSLTPAQRARVCTHPEHGPVTVDWVIAFFAGHERNHLPQLLAVGAAAAG